MLRFKTWIHPVLLEEEQPLRRHQDDKVRQLYNSVLDTLVGGAKKELNLSLSDIEDDSAAPGKPPAMKGAQVVKNKLEKSGIYAKMQQLGIPDLAQRALDTQNYLNKVANDQHIGPKDTVGGLLNKLFGDNAVAKYSKGLSSPTPSPTSHKPEDNNAPMPNATAPPASSEQSPGAPGTPPLGPPTGGMPPLGGSPPGPMPGGAPGMPPLGGSPPGPMPGMPPDPKQPLQSPGGPMPPMPPGGMF